MNTILFNLPKKSESNNWTPVKDFREVDFSKIEPLLRNMYNNIKKIEPEFEFSLMLENQSSPYLEDGATYYKKLTVEQKYLDQENTLGVLIPRLMHGNFLFLMEVTMCLYFF